MLFRRKQTPKTHRFHIRASNNSETVSGQFPPRKIAPWLELGLGLGLGLDYGWGQFSLESIVLEPSETILFIFREFNFY